MNNTDAVSESSSSTVVGNVAESDKTFLYSQPFEASLMLHNHGEEQNHFDNSTAENEKGTKAYSCSECASIFTSRMEFDEHLNSHPEHKPYICEFCEACFNRRSTLWNHKRIHSDHKPFKCPICQMQFKWKNSLKCHREMHMRKHDKCGNNGVFDVQAFNRASGYSTNTERGRRKTNGGKNRSKSANVGGTNDSISTSSSSDIIIDNCNNNDQFHNVKPPAAAAAAAAAAADNNIDQLSIFPELMADQQQFLNNATSVSVFDSVNCLPLPTVCLSGNSGDAFFNQHNNQQQFVFDNDNNILNANTSSLNEYGYGVAFSCSTTPTVAAYNPSYCLSTDELQPGSSSNNGGGAYVKVLPFDQW